MNAIKDKFKDFKENRETKRLINKVFKMAEKVIKKVTAT